MDTPENNRRNSLFKAKFLTSGIGGALCNSTEPSFRIEYNSGTRVENCIFVELVRERNKVD